MTGTTIPGAPLLGELVGGEPFNPAGPEFATWLNDMLLRTVAISVVTLTENTGAMLADNGGAFFLDGWTLSLDEASILTDGWHIDVLGPGTVEPSVGEGDAVVLAAGSSARVLCDGAAVFVLQGGGGGGRGSIDLVPIGAWDIGDTYATNEAVSFGGSSYVSIVDDNIGNQPDTSPGEWMLLAERGEQGEAGNDGASGTDGTNGTNGADGDDGREVELQNGTTHIQWRYEGDVSWTDLIAKADLKGETGDAGGDGTDGADGENGSNGWSPVLALASDGSRRVLQVNDWVGGEGTKPATGDYVGTSGLTSVIGDAVDIRGPAGAGSGDVNTSGSVTTQRLVRYADGTGDTIEDAGYTVAGVLSADNHTDGTTNKVFTATEKTKLAGVATGATANSSDATLLARANHTGTQAQSTVTDLTTDLAAKAPLDSPALTGNPTAPTQTAGNNTTRLATTAFVTAAIAALIDGAPGAIDTLNELAAALGDDPAFATTVNAAIAARLVAANNLSDLANAATARTNLGMSANGSALVVAANYAAMRTLLDLEAGTDFYSISAANAAFAAASHSHTVSALSDASANARSFLQAANYAAMKTLLSLAQADISGLTTASSPQFTGIELGHASDTTLSRSAAGILAVEGKRIADLATQNQPLTGGATVTSLALNSGNPVTTGTLTLDVGDCPLQHYTANGAHALSPGTVTGSCMVDVLNGASAGSRTLSGWTKVEGSFTNTSGDKFRCHCSVGSQGSLLIIQALQ